LTGENAGRDYSFLWNLATNCDLMNRAGPLPA
jgi:hypothetical protein